MLKKLIIIENGESFQYDSLEELVKDLISENYYNMSKNEKKDIITKKAWANFVHYNSRELNQNGDLSNIDDIFVLDDEITYILSLLTTNNIILLEEKNSNILTKYLDKSHFEDNYIVVNTYAKELLEKYMKK